VISDGLPTVVGRRCRAAGARRRTGRRQRYKGKVCIHTVRSAASGGRRVPAASQGDRLQFEPR
jgi:hypothetical protein